MQNKKQYRLKTIFATGWMDPKSTIALHSLFTEEPKSQLQMMNQQISMKKLTTMYQRQSYQNIHKVAMCRAQRNQNSQSLYARACMKQFPKRESVVKNTSPFRYIRRLNNRALTEPGGQQQIFLKKMSQINTKTRLELKIQNRSFSVIRARTSSKKPKQSKRRNTVGDNQCIEIEPWKFKEEQDFNDLHIL